MIRSGHDCGSRRTPGDLDPRARRVGTALALDLARNEAATQAQSTIDFVVGDVHALTFPDSTFDVVHAHQVLQHVADPVRALREMRRVCTPGGVVAVRDSDYEAFTWFPASGALDRWLELYRSAARANGGEPDAGRKLLAWVHAAGFSEVQSGSSTWCFATAEDRDWWGGMWASRILTSDLTGQLLRTGAATEAKLDGIAQAWLDWAAADDGWTSLLHGEIIATARASTPGRYRSSARPEPIGVAQPGRDIRQNGCPARSA